MTNSVTPAQRVVLVADDDPMSREYVGELLRAQGLRTVVVESGQAAIDVVRQQPVDLAILDIVMPGLSGVDACRVIKQLVGDTYLPVVLLTGRSDLDSRVEGLRLGADDYITKPFEEQEFLARVEAMLRIKQAHDDVQVAKQRLEASAVRDAETKLHNQTYFQERLVEEFRRAERHLEPLSCSAISIDVGEQALPADAIASIMRTLGTRLRRLVRSTDIVARTKPLEFGTLLPSTSLGGALVVAERAIESLGTRPVEYGGTQIEPRVSIGIGLYPSASVHGHDELIEAASIAMTRARRVGPNRVCVVQQHGYVFEPSLS